MRRYLSALVAMLLWCLAIPSADAHLMVAQRGTIRFLDGGAFFVASLPVSAFAGVDDDADGRLSDSELRAHRQDIAEQVRAGFQLRDADGPRPLQGLLINASGEHATAGQPAKQLVFMGRFALSSPERPVTLAVDLFGRDASEQTLQIKASRDEDVQLLMFAPDQKERALFAPAASVFTSYAVMGIEHILTGLDHLLFLLVVLATGWRFRQVIWALPAFTVGHAITLVAKVFGGLTVAPEIVEPAIAVTIVGMAGCDWYARRRGQPVATAGRLALVFGCALVHGMGLASSFDALGVDGWHQLPGVAGFNVGIEVGQVLVALGAVVLLALVRRLWGDARVVHMQYATSLAAIVVGGGWFVQRLWVG